MIRPCGSTFYRNGPRGAFNEFGTRVTASDSRKVFGFPSSVRRVSVDRRKGRAGAAGGGEKSRRAKSEDPIVKAK